MGATARKMVNLDIDETSGVDHPAHLSEGWLVLKSADGAEVSDVLDSVLTEEDSTMEKEPTTATEEQEVEKAADTMASLKARCADLEAQLADAKKEEKGEGDAVAKAVDPSEDFLKSAPAEVVAMIEGLRKSATDATEELQKERDTQADKEAIAKAKGWNNLNLNAEQVGPALRKLSGIDPELTKSFETMLSSLNAQAESANIFAELGKSVDGVDGDALGRFESMAKALVETNVAKSYADAITQVASANPELYKQYSDEKKGA